MKRMLASALLGAASLLAAPTTASAHHLKEGDSPEIILFTDLDPAFVDFLVTVFTAEAGVYVKIDYGVPDDLISWQAKDDDFRVDVMLTGDTGWLDQMSNFGKTAPYETEAIAARIPAPMRDPKGRWFGVTRHAFAFHVAAGAEDVAPASYEALAEPSWRGRLCAPALNDGDMLQLTTAMIGHHGAEAARTWLEALRANLSGSLEGDDRARIRYVAAGLCDVALVDSNVRGLMAEADEDRSAVEATRMLFPKFENGAAHISASAAALHADAPHPESARKFLDYLASEKGQRILMLLSHEHPVASDVELEGAVAEWGPLAQDYLPIPELSALEVEARRMLQSVASH